MSHYDPALADRTRATYGVKGREADRKAISALAKRLDAAGIPYRRSRIDQHCDRLVIDQMPADQRVIADRIFEEVT